MNLLLTPVLCQWLASEGYHYFVADDTTPKRICTLLTPVPFRPFSGQGMQKVYSVNGVLELIEENEGPGVMVKLDTKMLLNYVGGLITVFQRQTG